MKKLKLIIMTILLVVVIATFAIINVTYSASGAIDLWSLPNDGSWYKNNTYFSVSFAHLINFNNVYCIQKNQSFPRQGKYMQVRYKIVINGENAKIYKADPLYPDSGQLVKECDGAYNNLLAAIVSEEKMGLGYGSNSGNYNNSQIALYYYWNQWLQESGASAYMSGSSGNLTIVNTVGQGRINSIMEKYKEYASKYAYNATIYYMTPAFNSVQRLLLVERGPKTELNIDIPVQKNWLDGNNKFNTRRDITVELLANGVSTGQTLTLNSSNNWKSEFQDLDMRDSSGKKITYTIKEIGAPEGYISSTSGDMNNGYKITNTLLTEVKVIKQWDDKDDLAEFRPSTLKVTLYSNGVSTGKTVTLDSKNEWSATFKNLNKYDKNGNEIKYTVKEETIAKYETPVYSDSEDSKGYITWTITNKYVPKYDGYIEISGKVWNDGRGGKGNNINGIYDINDSLLEGIKVRLKYIDDNGNHVLFNSNLPNIYETKTDSNGEYTIRVNYDNSKDVYKLYEDINTINKKLKTAYVEFEYDGMKYTTVNNEIATKKITNSDGSESVVNVPSSEQSKAVENENTRNTFDANHSKVMPETLHPNKWTDKDITATTKTVISYEKGQPEEKEVVVKYCNGDGTCDRTNPEGAWMIIENQPNKYPCEKCPGTGHTMRTYNITIEKIPNINLGLFEREQPDVAIFSDLSKVQVTMKGQKYTYLYNVRSDEANNVGLQVKFQNKETYTYRRPVNPADIAYLQEEANKNEMSVIVTYEVKVANLSSTLPITVHNIINSFDSEYTLNTQGWTVIDKNGFKQATSGELNINVEPQKESSAIELTYTVSMDAIRNLLNEEATLNNAVEIGSYSVRYGTDTLYAEQRNGGRNNKSYAGYDYDSHPGNAGIVLNSETKRLESTNLVEYIAPDGTVKLVPEDDTDIAPSFVLCKSEDLKVLSGTIWEDIDKNLNDNERLGNGVYDSGEAKAGNVRVELYNLDGTIAKLYNEETKQLDKDAISKTAGNGIYFIEGVVTGEYYIKFTYGDDTTKLGHDATTFDNGATTVNARNYKSTIITDTTVIDADKGTTFKDLFNKNYDEFSSAEKKWHITHANGYSVAVDSMKERLEIEDLYYANYDNKLNMSAYTKPFETQIEFEATGSSKVNNLGNIEGITDTLDKLDFGISERPREDLFAQKTITNFKITLANGQILTEGNPTNADIAYAKTMGFRQQILKGEDARNSLEKQLLVEMDTELIQGAKVEIDYVIKVTNNNELDYDYGNKEDAEYVREFGDTGKAVYDKYITKNSKAKYYYYGEHEGLTEIQAVIEIADYMNKEMTYNQDTSKWTDLNENLVTHDVKDAIEENGYKATQAMKNSSTKIKIPRGESFVESMSAAKILSNKDNNVYDNNIEILKIDGKTARTIQESQNGVQIAKTYRPGNYEPSLAEGTFEQDDDRVKIIITPPTGIGNYLTHIAQILTVLIILLEVVILIKKKLRIK